MSNWQDHPYHKAQEAALQMLRDNEDPYSAMIDTAWFDFGTPGGNYPARILRDYDFSTQPDAADIPWATQASIARKHTRTCNTVPEAYHDSWKRLLTPEDDEAFPGIKATYRRQALRALMKVLDIRNPSPVVLGFNRGVTHLASLLGWSHKITHNKAIVVKGWSPTKCHAVMLGEVCSALADSDADAARYMELLQENSETAAVERCCIILASIDRFLSDESLATLSHAILEQDGQEYTVEQLREMVDDWESYTSLALGLGSYLFVPSEKYCDRLLKPNDNRIEFAYYQMTESVDSGDSEFTGWDAWYEKRLPKCFLESMLDDDGYVLPQLLEPLSIRDDDGRMHPVSPSRCRDFFPDESPFALCSRWMGCATDIMLERAAAMREWAMTTEENRILRRQEREVATDFE